MGEGIMNITVIGYGNMGRMLAECILRSGGKHQLIISNRSEVINPVKGTGNCIVSIEYDFSRAAENADILFLCVRPQACTEVMESISGNARQDALLVSIAADVDCGVLESYFPGRVMRMMPTLTSKADSGITLLSSGSRTVDSDYTLLSDLFGRIMDFVTVTEDEMGRLATVSSCGPGLVSSIFNEFVSSLCRAKDLDRELVSHIFVETVYGTCLLARQTGNDFRQIENEVATKGGTTGAGAEVLHGKLPDVFSEMNSAMLERRRKRRQEIEETVRERDAQSQ